MKVRPSHAVPPGSLEQLLTRRQRLTCALAWVERLTHEQIGAAQGISHWASKKRVQRARHRLRAAQIEPPTGHASTRKLRACSLSAIENV